jgi:long-chain acyl-CoA synthetase
VRPPEVVLAEPDQRLLLHRFAARLHAGDPVAVLDPTWPRGLTDAAVRQVGTAVADGRLGPGRMALFTSGSAGTPTGVLRTQASWRASLDPLTALLALTSDDVVWTPGPLWSSLSLYGAWHATTVGAGTVVGDEDPAAATVAHLVPSALDRLLGRDLPRLRAVVLAGEPVETRHREACRARGWAVHEYYGAAELSFVGWSSDGEGWEPFPGVEVELRRDGLRARSPYLALGPLDPSAGRGAARTDDGWAGVGDHAVQVHGRYRVTGRGSAAITTGGHTVVAEHVEQVLRTVPGVHEALVVGRPHPTLGEVVCALVVGPASADDLRAALGRLAPPSRPRRWARPAALPRTAAGKPDRAAARTGVADGTIPTGALR